MDITGDATGGIVVAGSYHITALTHHQSHLPELGTAAAMMPESVTTGGTVVAVLGLSTGPAPTVTSFPDRLAEGILEAPVGEARTFSVGVKATDKIVSHRGGAL